MFVEMLGSCNHFCCKQQIQIQNCWFFSFCTNLNIKIAYEQGKICLKIFDMWRYSWHELDGSFSFI